VSANLEVERKLLVLAAPSDAVLAAYATRALRIEQRYLAAAEGTEVRLRRIIDATGQRRFRTEKRVIATGVREEVETPIDAATYDQLLGETDPDRAPITKTRYEIPMADGLVLEVDVFEHPEGLVLAEVELPSLDTPFALPDWLGATRDVTDDARYSNAAIARRIAACAPH
jgi:adenylate cyclase